MHSYSGQNWTTIFSRGSRGEKNGNFPSQEKIFSNFLPQELNLDPLLTIMELITLTKSHILKAHRLINTILTKGPIDRVSFHKEYICYKFEMKAPTSMKFDTKN